MIIASTATPDFFYPTLACLVQNQIGAENACAIDINAACTGFVNCLDVARSFLVVGDYKKILVVSSEVLTRQTDFSDRGTCILFGDGAGAVVVEASDKRYESIIGAKGENIDDMALFCKVNFNCNSPFRPNADDTDSGFIRMDGKEVYKFASDIMPKTVNAVCEKAGWALSDIDLLIPHQANIRIIEAALKKLDIPAEKVYINIENTGNISSACIPVCLDELYEAGRIKPGMKICMVSFGGGLTYGGIALEV
jgi:3-oxoacyl-[acyl-carrier-protein] synthase-3